MVEHSKGAFSSAHVTEMFVGSPVVCNLATRPKNEGSRGNKNAASDFRGFSDALLRQARAVICEFGIESDAVKTFS